MKRHEFLQEVHDVWRPRTYLEVGVNDGRSLALSRTRSIAIDPGFKITTEICCDVQVAKATSDDFFARKNPVAHFPDGVIDLAFIDGLHLFEFVLRDFMNVERHSAWTSVIVLDDMLPRNVGEAARSRHTNAWTGDVYKLAEVLRRYRPDLATVAVNTAPTGLLLVLGADPTSSALRHGYDEILTEFVTDDPQIVPPDVLDRSIAVDPRRVLDAGFWRKLVDARTAGLNRMTGYPALRAAISADIRTGAPAATDLAQLRRPTGLRGIFARR